MTTDLNDLAFIQKTNPTPAPAKTWEQQNRAYIHARAQKAYGERDAAYESALRDFDNDARRRYARIHQTMQNIAVINGRPSIWEVLPADAVEQFDGPGYDEIMAALGNCDSTEKLDELRDTARSIYPSLEQGQKAQMTKAINAVSDELGAGSDDGATA